MLTDDDTLPIPSFLQAWAKFLDTKLDYELLGGSIIPLFETPPQSWLVADQHLCTLLFGQRDLPEGPVEPAEIFGGNMAVRRSVFNSGFRFKEDIGPNGSNPNYPMGGETDFCQRVALAGILSWFAKEPAVQHLVRSYQMTDSYLADRSYRMGRGACRLQKETNGRQMDEPPAFIAERLAAVRRRLSLRARLQMLSPYPNVAKGLTHITGIVGFFDEYDS